jgi:hypothetical protein
VPIITALWLERLLLRGWISRMVGKTLHILNLIITLALPVFVINTKYDFIGPGQFKKIKYFQKYFAFSNLVFVCFVTLEKVMSVESI